MFMAVSPQVRRPPLPLSPSSNCPMKRNDHYVREESIPGLRSSVQGYYSNNWNIIGGWKERRGRSQIAFDVYFLVWRLLPVLDLLLLLLLVDGRAWPHNISARALGLLSIFA